jgi:hypothetical protein
MNDALTNQAVNNGAEMQGSDGEWFGDKSDQYFCLESFTWCRNVLLVVSRDCTETPYDAWSNSELSNSLNWG